jgi:bacteriorhodopsin
VEFLSAAQKSTTLGIYIPELLRRLSWTRLVAALSMWLFVLANAAAIVCDSFAPDLFRRWTIFTRPVTDFFSRYLWAMSQMEAFFKAHKLDFRISVFNSVICLNLVMYLLVLVLLASAVLADFARSGRPVAETINSHLDKRGKSLGGFSGFHFVFWLVTLPLMLTSLGYANHPFDVDAYFVLMAFYFFISAYAFLYFFTCLVAYVVLRPGDRSSTLQSS